MSQSKSGKVTYRQGRIFYNGEPWNLIGVQSDNNAHIKIQLEKVATRETIQIRVHTDDISFIN